MYEMQKKYIYLQAFIIVTNPILHGKAYGVMTTNKNSKWYQKTKLKKLIEHLKKMANNEKIKKKFGKTFNLKHIKNVETRKNYEKDTIPCTHSHQTIFKQVQKTFSGFVAWCFTYRFPTYYKLVQDAGVWDTERRKLDIVYIWILTHIQLFFS